MTLLLLGYLLGMVVSALVVGACRAQLNDDADLVGWAILCVLWPATVLLLALSVLFRCGAWLRTRRSRDADRI